MNDLSYRNRLKYLKAPEWEQIKGFIKELGISDNQFERFYRIPYNTLTQIKNKKRKLPCKFWGIVYEKIKPAYGSGFLDDYIKIEKKKVENTMLTNVLTETVTEGHIDTRLAKIS